MRIRALIVALAAVALGGCGGGPRLSSGTASELHARVAAVRAAAEKGDRAGALTALDRLAGRVRDLAAAGSLADADAAALRRGIGRARRRVRAEIAAPTPAPTPAPLPTATPTPAATPAPPQGKPGKGKGRDKKPKGRGKKGKHD